MIPGIRLHVPPPEVLPPIHVYTGLPVIVLSHGHPEVSVPSLLALLEVVRTGAGTATRCARVIVGKSAGQTGSLGGRVEVRNAARLRRRCVMR